MHIYKTVGGLYRAEYKGLLAYGETHSEALKALLSLIWPALVRRA